MTTHYHNNIFPDIHINQPLPSNAREVEFERDLLFSIFNEVNGLTDKTQLLTTTYNRLRMLLPFNDIMITLADPNKRHHHIFLKSFEKKRNNHPDFNQLFSGSAPFNDGLVNEIMASTEPLSVCPERFKQHEKGSAYASFYQRTDIRQIVGIPMRNIGVLYILSEVANGFSINHIRLMKAVSVHFALLLSSMQASELIHARDTEQLALLELSNEIALIKDRDQLQHALQGKIRKLIPFNDITITIYNHKLNNHRAFLCYSEDRRTQHPDFEETRTAYSPINDGVVNRTLESNNPIIFQVDDLLKNPIVPSYAKFYSKSGIEEFAGVSMHNKDGIFGGLYLFSEKKQTYHPRQFNLIKAIANQVAAAVANILIYDEIIKKEKENNILLTFSNDISSIKEKDELLHMLHARLNSIFSFDHTDMMVIDADGDKFSTYSYDQHSICRRIPEHNSALKKGYTLEDSLLEKILGSELPLVFNLENMIQHHDCPAYIRMNYDFGMRQIVMVRLKSGDELKGYLILMSAVAIDFSTSELELIQAVCYQLSNAVANIIANDEIHVRENEKSILLAISNDLAAVRNKTDLDQVLNDRLKSLFSTMSVTTMKISEDGKWVSPFLPDATSAELFKVHDGIIDVAFDKGKPVTFDLNKLIKDPAMPAYLKTHYTLGMREVLVVGLNNGLHKTGVLAIFTDCSHRIKSEHLNLIQGISSQLAAAMTNIIANEKIERQVVEIFNFKKQLEVENLYLQEEIQTTHNYDEIVGTSAALQQVFKLVSMVSPTSSSVLILGETGTGKELIARALHNASPRRDKLMVKVNCATLPANLIESELFGHERGSFTGATDRRIGKFELANNSTLFLDEIGELPLDLQVKLLRALQEKEIERVGGRTVIKTDVRIIAATNRDLEKEVHLGNFRSDLYFRLNVFPIFIPPLRERKDDIPVLARHFLVKHSKKSGKKVLGFSSRVMKELDAYSWPGNVRELEHLVERSILLSTKPMITQMNLPGAENQSRYSNLTGTNIKTIAEVEREHIMNVLRYCKGKIAGTGGAAQVLRIPSTTLNSKIKKLGITKEYMTE